MKKILVTATVIALTISAPSAFAAQAKNTGLVGGAIAGAIVGGPVGAVVGGAVGYTVGSDMDHNNRQHRKVIRKHRDNDMQ